MLKLQTIIPGPHEKKEEENTTIATQFLRVGARRTLPKSLIFGSLKIPVEQNKLRELGTRLSDVDHWKNDPFDAVRFLHQNDMDVDQAEDLFRAMVKWRLENDIDGFMDRYQEPSELFWHSPFALLSGLDRDGDPIFVQRHGHFDAVGYYKQAGPQAMLDGNLFLSELVSRRDLASKKLRWQQDYYEPLAGRRFRQFTVIVDLQGLSASLLRPTLIDLLRQSSHIGQNYYPGLAKRAIIVRAPKIFRMAWGLVKHFYDEQVTRRLVFVTQDNYMEVLEEYVDPRHLPPCVNPEDGTGRTMPGYFENVQLEGGKLPRAKQM